MTPIIMPKRNRPEVADILRKHIGDYQEQYPAVVGASQDCI